MRSHPQDHGFFMTMGLGNAPDHFFKISGREEVGQGGEEFFEGRPGQKRAGKILHFYQTLPLGERIGFHAVEAQGLQAFFHAKFTENLTAENAEPAEKFQDKIYFPRILCGLCGE
jgi:hypothetical protein